MTTFKNGDINDVTIRIDDQKLIEYCASTYDPEDIFTQRQLIRWAEDNGYTLEK